MVLFGEITSPILGWCSMKTSTRFTNPCFSLLLDSWWLILCFWGLCISDLRIVMGSRRPCQIQLFQIYFPAIAKNGFNIQFLLLYPSVFKLNLFRWISPVSWSRFPKLVGFLSNTFCGAKHHSLLLYFPVWSVEPPVVQSFLVGYCHP